ncbi:MAG: DUF2283 domain-containing protein [Candidatus Margulisbacteria bacterium]|nr:DUF2283 domain-containing protein [Candidatus Margulisiibacteriota bacterium]
MAKMNIWYDEDGDFLEISIAKQKGFFKDVGNDIWERVTKKGKVIGFAVLNFKKRIKKQKREVTLPFKLSLQES